MKFKLVIVAIVLGLGFAAILFSVRQRNPIAELRVVDAAGRPVPGAAIQPDGYRPKNDGGHYSWQTNLAPNTLVLTDKDGRALIEYPKFAVERVEVGEVSFSVDHPDYCPDRPFRIVDRSPPPSAGWVKKLIHPVMVLMGITPRRTDPVVLVNGAAALVSARLNDQTNSLAPIYPWVAGVSTGRTNMWLATSNGSLFTRRLTPGPNLLRVAALPGGVPHFSEVVSFIAATNLTNQFTLALSPGVIVVGKLDDSVPRPITNGVVIAEVWSPTNSAGANTFKWHTWANISAQGTFTLEPLPPGRLELIAVCDEWVSQNHSLGNPLRRTGQQWTLETNALEIAVTMEPAGTLVANVSDTGGRPIQGAILTAWPNSHWGNYSSTVFPGARYSSAELLGGGKVFDRRAAQVRSFRATSDVSGIIILRNIPAGKFGYSVENDRYVMPINDRARANSATAFASQTVTQTVVLIPVGKDVLKN